MRPFSHGVSIGVLVFYGWNVLVFLQSFAQEFVISPTTVILRPGEDSPVFACQLSSGGLPFWQVNGVRYTLAGLSNGDLPGHNVSGDNITVSVPVNGTEYVCVIPTNPIIMSQPAFLYIAGPPEKVTNVEINLTNVEIDDSSVNFIMIWTEPFPNFDPIVNYTITIFCTNNLTCPAVYNTNNSMTSVFVRIITDLSKMNFISVTASNTIGSSNPAVRVIVAPGKVDMVTVKCTPVDMINQCNITWNAIIYGPSTIPSPLFYLVDYFGSNIIGDSIATGYTFATVELPPVQSVVSVSVSAVNVFGTGPRSNVVGDIINSPSVVNATVLLNAPSSFGYSIAVICTIHSDSGADHCVVMAVADGGVAITGIASITNGMATVTIDGLACGVTYTIIAGGTLNGDLVGPRSSHGTITTDLCSVISTTSTIASSFTMTTSIITATRTTITVITATTATSPISESTADGSSDDDGNFGPIIGAAVGIIVAVLMAALFFSILFIYFYRHKKYKGESKTGMSVNNPTYTSTGIYEEIDIKIESDMTVNNPRYVSSRSQVPSQSKGTYTVPSHSEENNVVPSQSEAPSQSEEANAAKDKESYHEYEDIINDVRIKMARNPSYSVPK